MNLNSLSIRCALAAIAVTVMAASAPAAEEEKFDLKYKFKAGDNIRYEIDHRASVRSTIDGATQEAQTRSESTKVWKVIDVLPSGEIEFINIVEEIRMTNRLPDRAEMHFDSSQDETPPPGFEDAAKAVGVPLSLVRMTANGEIIKREIKHHQPAADQDAPVAAMMPKEPVAVGDTWTEPLEVKANKPEGGTVAVSTRRRYKLLEVAHGVAKIESSYQVLTPMSPPIEAQLAQRLMNGVLRFDIEAGRLLSQEMKVDKRVLGFAGPTSSMHYVMKMNERIVEDHAEVASKPE